MPARVLTLTSEVLRTIMMTKLKMTAMIALSLGVLTMGVAVVAQPGAKVEEGASEKSPMDRPLLSVWDRIRRDDDMRNKLERPIDLNLPAEVPLFEFLRAIRVASKGADDDGIPIYVEPAGLQETNNHIGLEVSVGPKNKPLGMRLKSALRQLNLSYQVKDGLLVIDSRTELLESRLEAVERKLDRILKSLEGAKRDEGQ